MSAKHQSGGNINAEQDPDHSISTSSSFPAAERSGEKLDSRVTKSNSSSGAVQRQSDYQKRTTVMRRIFTTSFVLLGLSMALGYADQRAAKPRASLPAQAIFIEPSSFAVLPNNFPFRTDSSNQHFNPTNATPPFFQVFNEAFLDVLGPDASITEIASNATFAFAHEAPVYVRETDEVFFASNDGGPLGNSDLNHNNMVFKLSLAAAEKALQASGGKAVNVPVTHVPLSDSVQMTNGGTGPFKGDIILINSGRGTLPPNIVLVNPRPPNNVTVLLNNFYGRQFNSLNDIRVYPGTDILFFTDVQYGFINHFRNAPLIENHVYRFDTKTSAVRAVATDFDKPNGLAFTADGRTAYVADTGSGGGTPTEPSTIYAFDVDPKTHAFTNRRILAYVDAGFADGIQTDTNGNVFAACADGVHVCLSPFRWLDYQPDRPELPNIQVFSPDGTLLGKFFTNMLGANLVFAPPDRLVILAETKVFLAKVAAKGVVIDPKSFAVLPQDYPFRTDPFNQLFNPTNASTPIFQIFDPSFRDLLGSNPSIHEIASNSTAAFAHEAPVFVPETDEVFFASNGGSDLSIPGWVSKISLAEAEKLLKQSGGRDVNVTVTRIALDASIQEVNGGTGLFQGNIVFSNAGRGSSPPSLVLVNPRAPYNATTLLNNFYGRQFNSLNDVKILPGTDKIFFVDDTYGNIGGFRQAPSMPQTQVYRFDPKLGTVRAVATDFIEANGLAFDGDGKIAYVTDTGAAGRSLNFTGPATIYAFDVDAKTHAFTNRRIFAYVDAGIPDGIQVDTFGNVWAACWDGVQVFASDGTLLGKIFLNRLSANFIFAPPNRLVILAETKIYLARVAAHGVV
ncbi:hypothetical protein NP233_g3565 [Leucocoprinus birnbaumii]|uniref:SMP-30/Gluconolactonase/LRE-like region domain-containing protein n=1 Tax=Leucocoprinus birnbaumii TaxID=56174 RepID=A0AAD5W2V1_9AGAR|nr:hypothetical protein NP233_g3565 [Leucocoprinus birnbaumii]